MMTLKPLIFFGTENFSAPALLALIDECWPVKAVVTKPDSVRGRGQTMHNPLIKKIAIENDIPVLQPDKLMNIKPDLLSLGVNCGILVAYGKIIPQEIIDIFNSGIVNIHPSLLPKYRGPSPIEAAILNGDSEAGVSLMLLNAGMDEGPVYAQEKVALTGNENRLDLMNNLSQIGAKMLVHYLPSILDGSLKPKAQSGDDITYTKLLNKSDGKINWKDSAIENERKIRAYQGYPKPTANVSGHSVIVLASRVATNDNDGNLVVASGKGYIEITELIAPSGKKMSGEAFRRGYLKLV